MQVRFVLGCYAALSLAVNLVLVLGAEALAVMRLEQRRLQVCLQRGEEMEEAERRGMLASRR